MLDKSLKCTAALKPGGKGRAQPFDHWQELIAVYEKEPTLANYLSLRREFPGGDIEPSTLMDFDVFLFSVRKELEKHGIDAMLVCDAMDGDDRAIDELSLVLMERLIERDRKKTTTQTLGLGIPDSLANYLIAAALEAACRAGVLPSSLAVLARDRLCGLSPRVHKAYAARQRYGDAGFAAAQLGDDVRVRKLARLMGVSTGQAGKWLASAKFRQDVEAVIKTTRFPRSPLKLRAGG